VSTAAILWTHNEPEVLIPNIRYLLGQVDEILIRDRESDPEMLLALSLFSERVIVEKDDGHFNHDQSALMTQMAQWAAERGHEWVLPIDPDEVWYANNRPLREALGGISKDVAIVRAELYNHVASADDPWAGNPFETIGYRQRFPLPLGKVACRTRPDLVIEAGNHHATTGGVGLTVGPHLVIRHFPYRTEDQFIEKVRSNWEQIKKSNLSKDFGVHIRAYGRCLDDEGEDALRAHFRHWFYSSDPGKDDSLMYDPAPI
jgi:hypothetical protein